MALNNCMTSGIFNMCKVIFPGSVMDPKYFVSVAEAYAFIKRRNLQDSNFKCVEVNGIKVFNEETSAVIVYELAGCIKLN